MARQSDSRRITPKGTRPQNAPAPAVGSSREHSPAWFGWMIAGLLALGTFVIVANYLSWLPGSPTSAWIGVGLAIVLVGILFATRWR